MIYYDENQLLLTFVVEIDFLHQKQTEPFPNVSIRGTQGHGYYTDKFGEHGFFVGRHNEGEFSGQIQKAQSVSPKQLERLRNFNSID